MRVREISSSARKRGGGRRGRQRTPGKCDASGSQSSFRRMRPAHRNPTSSARGSPARVRRSQGGRRQRVRDAPPALAPPPEAAGGAHQEAKVAVLHVQGRAETHRVSGEVVCEDDRPHGRLPRAALAHQEHLVLWRQPGKGRRAVRRRHSIDVGGGVKNNTPSSSWPRHGPGWRVRPPKVPRCLAAALRAASGCWGQTERAPLARSKSNLQMSTP